MMGDELRQSDLEQAFPDWHFWTGANRLRYARRPKSSPPQVVRGEDWTDLRDQLLAWIRRRSWGAY